ncbi:TPA: hypothetical protein TXL63_002254 [Streptococcus suis]|nr:hypothetical protein [Streptococcus suis]
MSSFVRDEDSSLSKVLHITLETEDKVSYFFRNEAVFINGILFVLFYG